MSFWTPETNSTIETKNSTIETKTWNINSAKSFADENPLPSSEEKIKSLNSYWKEAWEIYNINQENKETNSTKTKNELADLKKELPFWDLTEWLWEEEINKMFNKKNWKAIVDWE